MFLVFLRMIILEIWSENIFVENWGSMLYT